MAESKPSDEARKPARPDPFDELFGGWSPFRGLAREWPRSFGAQEAGGRLLPAVDVAESEGAFVITAELPGTKPEDVTLELHDDVLTIGGEKRDERSGEDEQRRWSERVHGRFTRSFSLPANADPERVEAKFADGVLTIEVAKRQETKPKVIRIQE